jgi:hypothetical protein
LGIAPGQALPDALHITVDAIVTKDRQLFRHFLRCLTPGFDVVLHAVFVFRRDDLRLAEHQRNCGEQRDGRGGHPRRRMSIQSLNHNQSLKAGYVPKSPAAKRCFRARWSDFQDDRMLVIGPGVRFMRGAMGCEGFPSPTHVFPRP